MTRYVCSACALRFESDEARCPQCLRKSTVRAADAPAAVAARAAGARRARAVIVGTLAALLVLLAIGMTWLAVGQVELAVASHTVGGTVVSATIPELGIGFRRCDVDYRYAVAGVEHRGSAMVAFVCPDPGPVAVRVSSLDASVSDLGPGLGLVAFPVAALADYAAYAAVVVAMQLLFPRSERLRKLAAKVGSRYASERG